MVTKFKQWLRNKWIEVVLWWNYENSGAHVPIPTNPFNRDTLDKIKEINEKTKEIVITDGNLVLTKGHTYKRHKLGTLKMVMAEGPRKGMELSEYLNTRIPELKEEYKASKPIKIELVKEE